MIQRINEELVIQAAQEWAARSNKNVTEAAATAQEAISAFKITLKNDEYDEALAKLYREYDQS